MPVVCIAGMHRSGTSMVAELLRSCGLYLGTDEEFLPPNAFNAEGYFEHREFVEINDLLLSFFNGTWHYPPEAGGTFDVNQVPASLVERAQKAVQRFAGEPFWGWKDPRNSLTLPFWQQLIPDLKVVWCLRNPLEVARSLAHRDKFSNLFSFDLWQAYNQRLQRDMTPSPLITHYDAYFADSRAELRRVIEFAGLPAGQEVLERACAATISSLKHNRATLVDAIAAGAPFDVVTLYAETCLQAGPIYRRLIEGTGREGVSGTSEPRPGPSERDVLFWLKEREPVLQILVSGLADRERAIQEGSAKSAELEQRVTELSHELREISISKTWRAALILRHIATFYNRWRQDGTRAVLQTFFDRFGRRYRSWVARNQPDGRELAAQRSTSRGFAYRPLISIITPVYNADLVWLRAAIDSVRSQSYEDWELCIADDASTDPDVRPYLESIACEDTRIKVAFREKNGHISRASNSAIGLATGEFICMLDQDDVFYPHALFEMIKRLNANPALDLIYSDSDLLVNNQRGNPFFKPDWSPDFFYSNNYLNHLTLLRKSLVEEVGGFRPGFEGSQDYDLYLRVAARTDAEHIAHIPTVLYGWRSIPGSAASDLSNKHYAIAAGRKALYQWMNADRMRGDVQPGIVKNTFQIHYLLKDQPLVSLILTGDGKATGLQGCLDSLREKSDYGNVEILRVGESVPELHSAYNIRQIVPPVSVRGTAQRRNFAAQEAKGTYLFFLDENIKLATEQALPSLLEHAQRPEIGLVGPKILFTDGRICSAGIVLGLVNGTYAHIFRSYLDRTEYYHTNVVKNYVALSDLSFMISRDKFNQVSGYTQEFRSDRLSHLDFCIRLYEAGYRHLYTPFITVYNLALPDERLNVQQAAHFREKWRRYVENDPYYSPHFSRQRADFAL